MDVRQWSSDLILLLKQDRKAQVIAGVIVIILVWALFGEAPAHREVYVEHVQGPGTPAGDPHEGYEDLVTRFSQKLNEIDETTKQNAEANKQLKEDIVAFEERSAEIFKKLIERIADIEGQQGDGKDEIPPVDIDTEGVDDLGESGLQSFGPIDDQKVDVPDLPEPKHVVVVGAGDSVRVRLLAGVNAPTDGTPYPVVLELIDDVVGPDGQVLPLGNARLIAAAQGSLTDSRVLFRLTKLNIRYPDGSRNVINIDGWIVGEDGLRGMEGIPIDPLGKGIAGMLAAGTVEGFGDGVANQNTINQFNSDGSVRTFVDGDTTDYALGRGLNKAGGYWADFIEDRVNLLVPHIKVFSGREATAVFASSFTLEGLYDALNEEEELVFVSLD